MGITVRQSFVSAVIDACPRQAELNYIEKIPHKKSVALTIGSLFHETYEHFFKKQAEFESVSYIELMDYFMTLVHNLDATEIEWKDATQSAIQRDAMACIQSYYPIARSIFDIKAVEHPGEITLPNGHTITTRLDLQLYSGIREFKTSRVANSSYDGKEYFPDYGKYQIISKPQPYIHLLCFGMQPYEYNVIGKGHEVLVQRLPVLHTELAVYIYRVRVLEPVMEQIAAGIFPARRSGLCTVCPWAQDSKRCGMLLDE